MKLPKKIIIVVCITAVTTCLASFARQASQNLTQKMEILSGIGFPGEKWQNTEGDYYEFFELVSGGTNTKTLRGARNTHVKHTILSPQKNKIFDVDYFYDAFGRRTVSQNNRVIKRSFAIFFGSAEVLGVGLNDVDTIPSLFSKKMPNYKSYNYGFNGINTDYLNRMLETVDFSTEVAEKNGLLIYVISDGIYSSTADKFFQFTSVDMPKYKYEDEKINFFGTINEAPTLQHTLDIDKLKYYGTLKEVAPVLSEIKKYIFPAIGLSLVYLSDLILYTRDDHHLNCALIKKAQITFLNKYPASHFVILLDSTLSEQEHRQLLHCAKAADVAVIDSFLPRNDNFCTKPTCLFPTRDANEVITGKLVEYLTLNNN